MVARYDSSGGLDSGFAGDGKQTIHDSQPISGDAVVVQPDGKIVIAGQSAGDFLLMRLKADGTPDSTFSGDGQLTTDMGPNAGATALVLQPDGDLVAVGIAERSQDDTDFALARYTAEGVLDPGFSGDGKQLTDFGGNDIDRAFSAAIEPDGKLVAAGASGPGGTAQAMAVARYLPDGSLDPSFDADGKASVKFPDEGALATGVAVLPNDYEVVLGGICSRAAPFRIQTLQWRGSTGTGRLTTASPMAVAK